MPQLIELDLNLNCFNKDLESFPYPSKIKNLNLVGLHEHNI